ncbi:hypothetical protein, partial [Parabacteroides sp.]
MSDMERQDYIDMISSLRESNDQLKGMISDLRDTVRSLKEAAARHAELDAIKDKRMAELTEKVSSLTAALSQSV